MRPSVLLLLTAAAPTSAWVLYSARARWYNANDPNAANVAYMDHSATLVWEDKTSFPLDDVATRWTFQPSILPSGDACGTSDPPNFTSPTGGLSGGMTFALHKDFCTRMLPLFPEEETFRDWFLTCEDLRDSIKRSLDTWAINHPLLYFKDVTELCSHVESTESCPSAEIFIVPEDLDADASTTGDLAAWATHQLFLAPVYTTAGQRVQDGVEARKAKITVRAPTTKSDFCWYLDSTFCFQFHRWEDSEIPVRCSGTHRGLLLLLCVC